MEIRKTQRPARYAGGDKKAHVLSTKTRNPKPRQNVGPHPRFADFGGKVVGGSRGGRFLDRGIFPPRTLPPTLGEIAPELQTWISIKERRHGQQTVDCGCALATRNRSAVMLFNVRGFWIGGRREGALRISPCRARRCGVKRGREPRTLKSMTALLACSVPLS